MFSLQKKKKRQLCDVIQVLIDSMVVTILQYISVSNQYIVHLKLIQWLFYHCCVQLLLCSTLCNPMECRAPDFPVLHYLPEFTQHVC